MLLYQTPDIIINKRTKICPTTKGNVFDIKSDAKEFTRKSKLKKRFLGIEYNDESLLISILLFQIFQTD